jgi:hypothetical protein
MEHTESGTEGIMPPLDCGSLFACSSSRCVKVAQVPRGRRCPSASIVAV